VTDGPAGMSTPAADDGHAISYKVLTAGVPVLSSDGERLGAVVEALDNPREQIFDGIVFDGPGGRRFVDAPEVARIAERAVTLTITAAEAAQLPDRDDKGGAVFEAKAPRGPLGRGPLGRFFGTGGWKRK
jgi:hypothetical protein